MARLKPVFKRQANANALKIAAASVQKLGKLQTTKPSFREVIYVRKYVAPTLKTCTASHVQEL
jgi:hypothetical protein